MVTPPLLEPVVDALQRSPHVHVLTLFGSHARGAGDAQSDLDFQIITRRPELFRNAEWLPSTTESHLAYGLRPAFGRVVKVTVVYPDAEVDLVVLPLARLRLARWVVRSGLHRRSPKLTRQLGDLTIVLRPGFRVLKGGAVWSGFFERLLREVPDPSLDNGAVQYLGDCAFADFVSLERKVQRGELVAAQRWLHVHLVETHLKLLHEYRTRQGLRSYHDGRRIEQVLTAAELEPVRVEARPDADELLAAARGAMRAIRHLVQELVGQQPRWPLPL